MVNELYTVNIWVSLISLEQFMFTHIKLNKCQSNLFFFQNIQVQNISYTSKDKLKLIHITNDQQEDKI